MAISNEEFKTALSHFPSGVTVVTTVDAAGAFHGITVSAFCSVSLDPPLILVCIEKTAGSHDALAEAGAFVVNILSTAQAYLSEQFASLLPDKFAGVAHHPGNNDMPVLKGSVASLECKLVKACDGGDHTIFIGLVEDTSLGDGFPLIYTRSEYWKVSRAHEG